MQAVSGIQSSGSLLPATRQQSAAPSTLLEGAESIAPKVGALGSRLISRLFSSGKRLETSGLSKPYSAAIPEEQEHLAASREATSAAAESSRAIEMQPVLHDSVREVLDRHRSVAVQQQAAGQQQDVGFITRAVSELAALATPSMGEKALHELLGQLSLLTQQAGASQQPQPQKQQQVVPAASSAGRLAKDASLGFPSAPLWQAASIAASPAEAGPSVPGPSSSSEDVEVRAGPVCPSALAADPFACAHLGTVQLSQCTCLANELHSTWCLLVEMSASYRCWHALHL